jgi:hypothetical protein
MLKIIVYLNCDTHVEFLKGLEFILVKRCHAGCSILDTSILGVFRPINKIKLFPHSVIVFTGPVCCEVSFHVFSSLAFEKVVQSIRQVLIWQIPLGTMSKKKLLLPVRIDRCITFKEVQLSLFDSVIIWFLVVVARLSGSQDIRQSSNEVIYVLIL